MISRTLEAYKKYFGSMPDVDDEAWSFPILAGYHFVTFKMRE